MTEKQEVTPAPATPGSGTSPIRDDDAALVARLRVGGACRKLALNALLERQREWLLNHCTFRLGNRQDAQDVVQQVMLRAWQAFDSFEGRSAFRTWLYTIAENQCRSFAVQRMRYLQTEHIERLVELRAQSTAISDIDQLANTQAVSFALQQLSGKAREVLVLRYFHDCSLEETAAVLSISLSAAKMRLYRSLEQFKSEYLRLSGGTQAVAA